MTTMADLLDGRTLAQLDNEEKHELVKAATQGLVSELADQLWTPENIAKVMILAKTVEKGTEGQRNKLREVHIEKLYHSLLALVCLDVVIPISNLQMPEILNRMVMIEIQPQEEDDVLPPNLEGN